MRRRQMLAMLPCAAVFAAGSVNFDVRAAGFDHSHAAFTALLKKHVLVLRNGQASQVRYGGLAADRPALKAYLDSLSAITPAEFAAFSQPQRMAFLINAYNAFTLELILTRWPNLESIKDLGSLFQSPWKPKWVPLLGSKVSLDNIEHDMLRERGRFDDPRVHFGVNCASIGCPSLREEAFTAVRLDAQLEEQTLRFMSDSSRNRYDPASGKLQVSRIFDWFGEDFRLGHKGVATLPGFMARYADVLTELPAGRARVRAGQADIGFLDYDWKLNDAPR
jgi:hypothetical protein